VKNLFITGNPGVGKTTIIKKLAHILPPNYINGFYTEEIRSGFKRTGFSISTFDGYEKTMSHVDFKSGYRVGKYFVKIESIDEIVIRLKNMQPEPKLYLIDEIGKMESFSPTFRNWVEDLIKCKTPIIASIAIRGNQWIESVKKIAGFQTMELTPKNRDGVAKELQNEISKSIIL